MTPTRIEGPATAAAALIRWARDPEARQHLRWQVAQQVNRLPGMCWSNLVSWALANPGDRQYPWWQPFRRQDEGCRADFAACGMCMCSRLITPEANEAWAERVVAVLERHDAMQERPQ